MQILQGKIFLLGNIKPGSRFASVATGLYRVSHFYETQFPILLNKKRVGGNSTSETMTLNDKNVIKSLVLFCIIRLIMGTKVKSTLTTFRNKCL